MLCPRLRDIWPTWSEEGEGLPPSQKPTGGRGFLRFPWVSGREGADPVADPRCKAPLELITIMDGIRFPSVSCQHARKLAQGAVGRLTMWSSSINSEGHNEAHDSPNTLALASNVSKVYKSILDSGDHEQKSGRSKRKVP